MSTFQLCYGHGINVGLFIIAKRKKEQGYYGHEPMAQLLGALIIATMRLRIQVMLPIGRRVKRTPDLSHSRYVHVFENQRIFHDFKFNGKKKAITQSWSPNYGVLVGLDGI